MATIDKLTLELSADGLNGFIKSMEAAESGLKQVRDAMEKTAKENGIFDKKLDKKDKKKQNKTKKDDKTKEKASSKLNKNIAEGTKSLDKFLKTLVAISGISFGLSGLMSKSELAAKTGTDLANQTRNTTVKTEDLEAAQTASEAGGVSKNALDGLVAMFAKNQNEYLARGGVDMGTQDLLGRLNGLDQSGSQVQTTNTAPIETIKSLAKMLQNNSTERRSFLADQMVEMGVSSEAVKLISHPKFFDYLKTGTDLAIQNKNRTERAQNNQAALTFSKKGVENQWMVLGENFTPTMIKLNKLAESILIEVNKMQPLFDEAMPGLYKIADTILDWTKRILGTLKDYGLDGDGKITEEGVKNIGAISYAGAAISMIGDSNERSKDQPWYNKGEIDLNKALVENWDEKLKLGDDAKSNYIKKYDEMIESIGDGVIKFSNGQQYGGDWWDKLMSNFDFPTYLTDHFDELLKEQPSNQQLMQNSNIAPSNSSSQIINIDTMNVNTNENNAKAIVNNGLSDSNIIRMSGSSAMSFMHNVG